ncbi:hypothetical protein NLM24_25390 [Nocardia zapadnayensis]|uniref:hypothetical protein n=1 Tax=Nocardia rhamnosiphila TaxID=426716 RepID=UPI002246132E|nr:hypothetical protein [Nocardia zapadnayensis]MCX0273965.1 hypothetical protein [Nocardia zapadnayensis]
MTRYAHFVGSLPETLMTSDREVLEWFADHSDGWPLTAVPRDLDAGWVVAYLRSLEERNAFDIVRTGDYADYSDMRSYGVRPGHILEPLDVAMGRVERIGAIVSEFESLQRSRPGLADKRVQISQPNPLDLALYVFAGAAVSLGLPVVPAIRNIGVVVTALRHLPVFTEAVLQEMSEVTARHGDRVMWQVESPIATLGMVKAEQLRAQWSLGPLLARQLGGFLVRTHEIGAATTLHLCYGDHKHKNLLTPDGLGPVVNLLGNLSRLLRKREVPLPVVHVPCAYGADPAPLDPAFYRPLRRLDPDWRLIAGVVGPDDVDDSIRALTLFEHASGRTAYGVATACGLGRRTVDDARSAATATITAARADIDAFRLAT